MASTSRKRNSHFQLHSHAVGLWLPTNLILSLVLGIVSLSFFQKIRGGGTPTTRHSSLTGVPSGIPMFCSFSKIWGGCFISFSAADASFDYSFKKIIIIKMRERLQLKEQITQNLRFWPCFLGGSFSNPHKQPWTSQW